MMMTPGFPRPLSQYAASSDYVAYHQQAETSQTQRGEFARQQGSEVVNPDVSAFAPILGSEEVVDSGHVPVTRKNMGTEHFAPEPIPDVSMLAPQTDQQRDAEMGWGAGGSVLVDAVEKLEGMDRARNQADVLMKASGEVLINAARELEQRDMARASSVPDDPNSIISQRLSGGTRTNLDAVAQESPATAASRIISQRLAGALAPQTDNASAVSPKPQRDGWSR
jgi:hypothetical protein